jgi:hypothetical protein
MSDNNDETIESILASVRKKHAVEDKMPIAPSRMAKADGGFMEHKHAQWRLRRHWLATMHCLGASMGQLSHMEGVRRSSVLQAIDKVLPVEIRSSQRLKTEMGWTELSWYTEKYTVHKEKLASMEPRQAASVLYENERFGED